MNRHDDIMLQKSFKLSCKHGKICNNFTFIVTSLVCIVIHCETIGVFIVIENLGDFGGIKYFETSLSQ